MQMPLILAEIHKNSKNSYRIDYVNINAEKHLFVKINYIYISG